MNNITSNNISVDLHTNIRDVLLSARSQVRQAVNHTMVQTYWQIGRLIVEDEQSGAARAVYGKNVLNELAKRLSVEFGAGFSSTNLKLFRQFYQTYPIGHSVSDQFKFAQLSWTHHRQLLRVENPQAREWYANESIEQGWSVRALDRQISTFFYERLLNSQDKLAVRDEATQNIAAQAPADPRDFIRDPYVLEFLGVSAQPDLYEKDLEQGLLNQLQPFLMELGKGFAFVARQKRVHVEGEDYFIDLVFYNYLLKCFVLIDLKIGKLTHQDVGQMDMYIRLFDQQYKNEGDLPTLGLILSSERNAAVAKYSLLADKPQLFASKYRLILPTEAELQAELERDRFLLESPAGLSGL